MKSINKRYAGLILTVLALLAILSYTASAQAGCCCNFQTGTAYQESFLEQEDCPLPNRITWPNTEDIENNLTCIEICSAVAEEEEEDDDPFDIPGRKCGDAGYKPGPTNPSATNVKGEKQIRLVWEAECPVDYFAVLRCTGANCENFELLTDQISTPYFIDDSTSLLWNQDYTYRIIAHYNLQGDSEPTDIVKNTGDIECWKRFENEKFCISQTYYSQFADYLKSRGYGFTPPGDFVINFSGSVKEQFFDKFNIAFSCGDDNRLSSGDDVCARKGITGICVVDEGVSDCIVPTDCESTEAGGTFGLFYDEIACEGTSLDKRFCYLDSSSSIIDKCYNCDFEMSCYDYRSERACSKDNCGVGQCTWKEVFPEIGVGVCVDERFSNCYLCEKKPTGPSSEAYNEVFDQCSEEKSEALSTEEYPCYWRNWRSLSCDDVTCRTYKRPSECASPSGGIKLAENNSVIVESEDPCEIGVCQWRPNPLNPDQGECLKNADGNSGIWPDCTFAENPEECELDYIPPDTTIVASGALGVYDKLHVNIFDKISRTDPGEYKTGRKAVGYTTYFCHYPEGQPECNLKENSIAINSSSLALEYLTLHNTEIMETQSKLADLAVGYNFIKYYSTDPSRNPGIIKQVRVYACERCVGPQIVDYEMEGAIHIGNKIYTNSVMPVLHASFDIDAEITTAEINTPDGFFISSLSRDSQNGKNFTFETQSVLEEGNYVFRINARDDEGTYMNEEFVLPFTLDLTAGFVNFTVDGKPAEGRTINKSAGNVEIIFEEALTDIRIFMNRKEVTGSFVRQGDKRFTSGNLQLDEGTVVLRVEAKDLANNTINAATTFFVNGKPPVIMIRHPSFGVSPNFKFNLTIETLNHVECKFLYDVPIPQNYTFADLEPFDSTGTNMHVIEEFTRIPDGDFSTHQIHVFCIDPLWGDATESFNLSVDVDPPVIEKAYADPMVIKESLAESVFGTLFKIKTNEDTFCKYSRTSQNYENMEYEFPGYIFSPHIPYPNAFEISKEAHVMQVNVTEKNRSYTYYAACEDLAGRVSATKPIDFSVNLSIGFDIFDRTPAYTNTTSINLAIESNKRAFCFYGRDNTSITSSFQDDRLYSHTTNLVNLPLGENIFYVQCFTKFATPKETSKVLKVNFTVDNTPPEMTFVDDSSNLVSDPGISYMKGMLRAKWLGEDNQTQVTRYYYMIETFYGNVQIINWTASTIANDWVVVSGLNLTKDTTYRFVVEPENAAGLIGDSLGSDGVIFDPTQAPASCNNSMLDADETDLDCGNNCPPCADGLNCSENFDCMSGFCFNGTCKAAACDDLVHNGQESDVDCGGICLPCRIGKMCKTGDDCESGNCVNGLCSEPDPCTNGDLDGTESDVDCGGSCPYKCDLGKTCFEGGDCSSGLCENNVCIPRKQEGESCINDSECASGLVCKDGTCRIRKAEFGETCSSSEQCEEGLICYQNRCVLDTDGDGMPDEWEIMYGFNPDDPLDASLDSDNDGISNSQEFSIGTNPTSRDSDEDGWYDGQELDFGTDPLDSDSRPSAFTGLFYHPIVYWWLWLIIILVFLIIGVGGFYGYNTYKEYQADKERSKKEQTSFAAKPEEKPSRVRPLTDEQKRMLAKQAEKDKEIEEKLDKVKNIIQKKVETKEEVTPKEWKDISELKAPLEKEAPEEAEPVFEELEKLKKGKLGIKGRKDALEELEKLIGKKEKEVQEEEKEKESILKKAEKNKKDPFKKLAELGKNAKLTQQEREEALKSISESPIDKLRKTALSTVPEKERKEILEKLLLLKTGKLNADERKKLFEKLRKIAKSYEEERKKSKSKKTKKTKKKSKSKKTKKSKRGKKK